MHGGDERDPPGGIATFERAGGSPPAERRTPSVCTGRVRLDIVAQAIRAAALLLTENVDQMAQMLVHYIDPSLGIPFSPDATSRQYNVWTAMFAEQALFAAECDPSDARLADLRLCLV